MNKVACFLLSMFLLSIGIWHHSQQPVCADTYAQCTQRTTSKEATPEQRESAISPVRFGTLYLWAKAFAWLPSLIKKTSIAM